MHAMALARRTSLALWSLLGLQGLSLPLSSARQAPDAAEVVSACFFAYTLKLDLPGSNHHTIRASDFQRKAWDFYLGEPVAAPLEEAYWILALPTEFQEDVSKECAAMVILAYFLVAETKLYLEPAQAMEYVETGVSVLRRIESRTQTMIVESWPVDEALQRFKAEQLSLQTFQATLRDGFMVDFVVSHCREDLAWLQTALTRWSLGGLARLFLYEKCGQQGDVGGVVPTVSVPVVDGPPGGRKDECSAYLTHCLHAARDGNLAVYTLFLQADAPAHTRPHLLNLVVQSIKHGSLDVQFLHLSNARMVSSTSTCKRAIFQQVVGRQPETLPRSYCCAQFLVRRDIITQRGAQIWDNALVAMDAPLPPGCEAVKKPGMHCLVYESIWHVMFGEREQMRPRAEDVRLPIFLRSQESDASDLPSGANSTVYFQNAAGVDTAWLDDLETNNNRDMSGASSIGYSKIG
mmetsp:Transcript_25926/g.83619  ORF Transcript_25926/g.83619 Transcript_25926/m.83619 type:complete len:463 (+) Transcript_25926:110-1498(+)